MLAKIKGQGGQGGGDGKITSILQKSYADKLLLYLIPI